MGGRNVKGRQSGSVPQLAECSRGKREALGSRVPVGTRFSQLYVGTKQVETRLICG